MRSPVGSKDNAMSYVNKLRDNRIKNNVALTATDKDEALRIVWTNVAGNLPSRVSTA